jgi:hypothetical protein
MLARYRPRGLTVASQIDDRMGWMTRLHLW